jgi:hypothetical protein
MQKQVEYKKQLIPEKIRKGLKKYKYYIVDYMLYTLHENN